jgi:hypothetical protein
MGLRKLFKAIVDPVSVITGAPSIADNLNEQIKATWDGIRKGESVGDTLANSLGAGQRYATDSIDKAFGRAGEAVADYGRGLTAAEGKNLRGTDDVVKAVAQGDVHQGLNTFDDNSRDFVRDPYVFPILMAAASYFGGPAISGALGGGAAGAAGAGAVMGAGGATVQGDSNLTDATTKGALGGLINYGTSSSFKGTTGSTVGDAALSSGTSSALKSAAAGDSSNDILRSGVIGAASGAAGQYLGETVGTEQDPSKAAGMFGSTATNMGLSRMWESEAQKDAYDPYAWALDYYSKYNNQRSNAMQNILQEGDLGAELALTPGGANLLSMFESEKATPSAGTGTGQYGSTMDQYAVSDPERQRIAG